MADVAAIPASSSDAPSTPKKGKKEKKIARPKAAHPPTAVMVNEAIQTLKERGGSSLQAIKKYISATYKVDADKFAPFIKKYLKSSVISGTLIQTKGKGASGSFKLTPTVSSLNKGTASRPKKPVKVAKSPVKPKQKAAEKPVTTPRKTAAAKKAAKPMRTPISEKKKAAAKVALAKAKSPSKAKKTAKSPTKKPKSPKPKTTKTKTAKTAKKTSPKKK